MQYLCARHYNQSNGSFNRLDPYDGDLSNPQSLNKYAMFMEIQLMVSIRQVDFLLLPKQWFQV